MYFVYTAVFILSNKIVYFLFCVFHTGLYFGLLTTNNNTASMTGGLVQQTSHVILPSIQPNITLVATLMAIVVKCRVIYSCT